MQSANAESLQNNNSNRDDDAVHQALFTFMAEGLIHISVQDGEESSEVISKNLGTLQNLLINMKKEASQSSPLDNNHFTESVNAALTQITESIISLQSFDRISQRLNHATEYLKSGPNTANIKWSADPDLNLQQIIIKLYEQLSIDDEKKLFEAIHSGMPIQDAIKLSITELKVNMDDDNIDLF